MKWQSAKWATQTSHALFVVASVGAMVLSSIAELTWG